ncbi:hypothetical protein [Rhizocola hellebori]|nr:hypothetical protein [Rhizocola hellebori]
MTTVTHTGQATKLCINASARTAANGSMSALIRLRFRVRSAGNDVVM